MKYLPLRPINHRFKGASIISNLFKFDRQSETRSLHYHLRSSQICNYNPLFIAFLFVNSIILIVLVIFSSVLLPVAEHKQADRWMYCQACFLTNAQWVHFQLSFQYTATHKHNNYHSDVLFRFAFYLLRLQRRNAQSN